MGNQISRRNIVAVLFAVPAIALGAPPPQQGRQPANGVYAVLREGPTREEVEQEKTAHFTILYDRKYLDEAVKQPAKYVALDSSSFVPFVLAGPPQIDGTYRDHPTLSLRLSPDNVKLLEKFTSTHMGGSVATVIDGEIITMHKVRSVIKDGQVQISRCTDNACRILRMKLAK